MFVKMFTIQILKQSRLVILKCVVNDTFVKQMLSFLLGLRSIYLNENFINTEVKHSMAIALSAITGKQERLISLSKNDKLSVLVPTHVRINTNIMYNQFVVQNMDFQEGDSGTCIYSPFTGSDDIGCIGMLIGKATSGECIVTPMKEILKALEVDSKA